MGGLYIHIPFCASRCIYCDFYSTTLRGRSHTYVTRLLEELTEKLADKRQYQGLTPLTTIYLGGGTPSQLESGEMQRLLDGIGQRCDTSQVEEVTMEMNPDDVTGYPLPRQVNRVSLGVQTMADAELHLINRRHDAQTVREAVACLRQQGIRNISLDLIYGLPSQTMETWQYSIEEVLQLHPEHISAYNLQVEEGTRLNTLIRKGELTVADDETCIAMNEYLRQRLETAGYIQYEISNYCLPGYHSRHNSSYWVGTPYIGLGPGAHSYDGHRCRSWNAPRVLDYLRGERHQGQEELTDTDLYNERVMLGLRTRQGVEQAVFPVEQRKVVAALIGRGLLEPTTNQRIHLTNQGLPLADEVIRELFLV